MGLKSLSGGLLREGMVEVFQQEIVQNLIALANKTASGIQKRIQILYPLRGKIALVEKDQKVLESAKQ